MENNSFKCTKCQHQEYEQGEIRVAGGIWSKIFNVQGSKFVSISCKQCGHTEFYKGNTKKFSNIVDILTNF